MASRLARSPTVQTLAAFLVVFVVSYPLKFVLPGLFAFLFTLSSPLFQPWAVITSVYSHIDVFHLLSNSIALVFVGLPLERATRSWAYHAFFVTTGAIAGITQVYLGGLLGLVGIGSYGAVLGASGAVFAVAGYVLAGNRLSEGIFDRLGLPPKLQVGLFVAAAAAVTWATAAPGVALIAHFTGLLVGLVAGRAGILPEKRSGRRSEPTGYGTGR